MSCDAIATLVALRAPAFSKLALPCFDYSHGEVTAAGTKGKLLRPEGHSQSGVESFSRNSAYLSSCRESRK